MAQDATLHIKLDRETDDRLRQLAEARRVSKAQLVRDAIAACYQTSLADLLVAQARAVAAYQGGYISLGKLAQTMGLHVLHVRPWLEERGIAQLTAYGEDDAAHA